MIIFLNQTRLAQKNPRFDDNPLEKTKTVKSASFAMNNGTVFKQNQLLKHFLFSTADSLFKRIIHYVKSNETLFYRI